MTEEDQNTVSKPKSHKASNIVLVGLTGCGKSTIGWLLSKQIGYGFIDLDGWIERNEKKPIEKVFSDLGETKFRELETKAIENIKTIKNHVIAVGSGALISNENFEILNSISNMIWIDCLIEEVVFRLNKNDEELMKRPLLSDLLNEKDLKVRNGQLKERLSTLLAQRKSQFERADIAFYDSYSTTDGSVRQLKKMLCDKGYIKNMLPRFVNKQDE